MSRKNLSVNPACGANVTGWGGGSTPTRSTGLTGLPVTTGAHYTANGYAQTPTGAASPGVAYTGSLYVSNGTTISLGTKIIYLAFVRSSGGDDFSNTVNFALPTGVTRVNVTATAPANTTGLYMIVDSFNGAVGAGVDITACLLEASGSLATYFDGNTAGASWDGTADNSTSTLADVGVTPNGIHLTPAAGTPSSTYGLSVTPTGIHLTTSLGNPSTATPARGDGWAQYGNILRADVDELRRQREAGITVCPFHDERLQTGPRGELHCPFGGEVFDRGGQQIYGWRQRLGEDWLNS